MHIHAHIHIHPTAHHRTDLPTDTDTETGPNTCASGSQIEICAVTTCAKWGKLCIVLCFVYRNLCNMYAWQVGRHAFLGSMKFWVCLGYRTEERNCGSTTRHTYRPGASIETRRFGDGKFSYNNKWKWQQQRRKRQDKLNKDQTLPLFVLIFPPPQPPSTPKKTG